jgi:hypothetical protein
MRSIKRIFITKQEQNPFKSDYLCFAEVVSGRHFSEDRINRHFNNLVTKDDYSLSEKGSILRFLHQLTRT